MHETILNGQFNSFTILIEQGKADPHVIDNKGDTLLHYAAIGQGNSNLFLRYLIKKCKVDVFKPNFEKLTAR